MSEITFLKGRDVSVKLNNRVLGGVLSLSCKTENKPTELKEFLNPEPYETMYDTLYTIELALDSTAVDYFERVTDYILEITYGTRVETYRNCTVVQKTTEVSPKGYLQRKVRLESKVKEIVL